MAMISSVTVSSASRVISSRIRRSSGPIPSIGRDRPAEHVVAAAELPGPLDRDDVLGLLDDADHREVAAWVPADPALLLLGDVAADRAEPDLVLDLGQRSHQPSNIDRIGGEQVERDPLGALRADAGKPAELVDQVLDRAFVHVARRPRSLAGRGCRPCRRSSGPMVWAASSSAARLASRTAATTRSCSVSMSSGSTALGSITARSARRRRSASRAPDHRRRCLRRWRPQLFLGRSQLLLHLLGLLHQLLHVRLGGMP